MMRKLMWSGFVAASLLRVGAVCLGCSSSTSASAPLDAASDAITSGETGTLEDATSEAAPPCTPVSGMADAIDAATFACYSAACMSSLTACAADCDCNRTILTAVTCTQSGMSAGTCFGPAIASSNALVGPVVTCLGNNSECMMADGGDAGTAGPDGEAGTAGTDGEAGTAGPDREDGGGDSGTILDAADGGE
jgi:hypothetical protein